MMLKQIANTIAADLDLVKFNLVEFKNGIKLIYFFLIALRCVTTRCVTTKKDLVLSKIFF